MVERFLFKDLDMTNIVREVIYMKRKIVIIMISIVFVGLFFPMVQSHSGAELEVVISSGWDYPMPRYRVKNIGDTPAHNAVITDTAVDGNILYNNRDFKIADVIEPGDIVYCDSNSWFVGFGVFSMVVTVTSDEGVYSSEKTNGFIFGILTFIP